MIFMVNPPGRSVRDNPPHHLLGPFGMKLISRKRKSTKRRSSRSTGGRKMAKRRTAAQKAATRKLVAFNRRKGKGGGKRRRSSGRKRSRVRVSATRRRRLPGTPRVKRRWKSRRRPRALRSSSRRSARGRAPTSRTRAAGRTLRNRRWKLYGNPGYVRKFKQGLTDAAYIAGGEMATNLVGNLLPAIPGLGAYPTVGMVVKRGIVAFAVGFGTEKVMGYDAARMAFAGGLLSVVKTGINYAINALPAGSIKNTVAGALSGDDDLGSYPSMGAYPEVLSLPGGGLAGYADMGESYYDESAYQQ